MISIVNVDNLTATPTVPLRAQAGVAWTIGKLTLAADVIFLAPRDVSDDTDKTAQGLDRRVVRNAVLNGSVGGEYLLGSSFPLRAGFFTDFAASNSPVAHAATAANQPENTSHVNRYGASFSIGYQTEHTETDFGTNVTFGSGQDLIPYNLNFSDLRVTSATSRNLYLFLSSAYRF